MFKKLLFVALAIGLLAACNNQENEKSTVVSSTEFATVAENLIDQKVSIEGTVLHVCKHGGKKMFIGDDRVKIVASELIASFDPEWEGSNYIVEGFIREEAVPVLAENTGEPVHAEGEPSETEVKQEVTEDPDKEVIEAAQIESADALPAAECDMEKVKPLYVIEVVKVTEKLK